MVVIAGRVDQKGEGETKLVAQSVRAFVPEEGAEEERLLVRVPLSRLATTPLDDLRRLLADHRGEAPVVVDVETAVGRRRLRLGEEFRVDPRDNGLVAELKTLFGERCLA
jgi:DNA polymerase III alpha subunit